MATRLRNYRGARGKFNACGGDVSPIWEATPHNGNLQRSRKPDSRGSESRRLQAIGRMSKRISFLLLVWSDAPQGQCRLKKCNLCSYGRARIRRLERTILFI